MDVCSLVVDVCSFVVVDVGLFKVALWRSLLVDGQLFDGVGWCMLVSL